jgi:hypothetical protein
MAKGKSIIMSPAKFEGSSCEPPKGTTVDGLIGYGAKTRTMGPNSEKEVTFDSAQGPTKGGL